MLWADGPGLQVPDCAAAGLSREDCLRAGLPTLSSAPVFIPDEHWREVGGFWRTPGALLVTAGEAFLKRAATRGLGAPCAVLHRVWAHKGEYGSGEGDGGGGGVVGDAAAPPPRILRDRHSIPFLVRIVAQSEEDEVQRGLGGGEAAVAAVVD